MLPGFLQIAFDGITEMLSAANTWNDKAVIVIIINASNWIVIRRVSVLESWNDS
jgi:hypothetical protein